MRLALAVLLIAFLVVASPALAAKKKPKHPVKMCGVYFKYRC
jgi:hypothetical protein